MGHVDLRPEPASLMKLRRAQWRRSGRCSASFVRFPLSESPRWFFASHLCQVWGELRLALGAALAPPDPNQQIIFNWMPLIFTFMLANFPAGLVIYWAWNNTLSVTQQYIIMRRQGVPVDLLGNIASTFRRPPKPIEPAKPAENLPVPANDTGSPRPISRSKAKRAAKAKPSSADA